MIGNKSKISLSDTEQYQTSTTNLSWKKHKLQQRINANIHEQVVILGPLCLAGIQGVSIP